MVKKRSPLGKGLESLLPESSKASKKNFFQCPVKDIAANPLQPRTEFNEAALSELTSSIVTHGIIQPLIVQENGSEDGYILIAGERRLRAAKRAGLKEVPVVVRRETDNQKLLAEALIENIQREDLNPIEEARAFHRLMDEFNLTQEQVATRVGKKRSSVANALRLLHLPDYIVSDISNGILTAGHARVLLGFLDKPVELKQLRNDILKKGMSVREAEREGKRRSTQPRSNSGKRAPSTKHSLSDSYCRSITGAIEQQLGSKVRIRQNGSRGTIEVSYYSVEDLERIVERLAKTYEMKG